MPAKENALVFGVRWRKKKGPSLPARLHSSVILSGPGCGDEWKSGSLFRLTDTQSDVFAGRKSCVQDVKLTSDPASRMEGQCSMYEVAFQECSYS